MTSNQPSTDKALPECTCTPEAHTQCIVHRYDGPSTDVKTSELLPEDDDVFTVPPEIIALHKRMDLGQEPVVKALAESISYGRLMQLTNKLWKQKDPIGAFVYGPCEYSVVVCDHAIKDSNGHCDICCGAGWITKGVKELIDTRTPQPVGDVEAVAEALNKESTQRYGETHNQYRERQAKAAIAAMGRA